MKWSTPSPLASIQNSQKHTYFLVLMDNMSPMSLLRTECSSLIPGMVSQYHGMDLFTSPRETSQKNLHHKKHHIYIYNNTNTFIKFQLSCCSYLHTSLACSWPWWPEFCVHQSTTSVENLSRDALWLIWYLRSAHFTHAPAPSCSPFPCPVSKNLQVCRIHVSLWRGLN